MTTSTSTDPGMRTLPDHLVAFGLVHVALRRDVRRLTAVADRVTPATAGRVRSWWSAVHDVVDWHHRTEDDIVWPELRRRVPGFAAAERTMDHHHADLEDALAAVVAALAPGADAGRLAPAARHLDRLLTEHLAAEEAIVFPAFADGMTKRQYLWMERRLIANASPAVLATLLPWLLDGADRRTAARMLRFVPPPLQVAAGTVLRWRYQRTVRPVLDLI
ncbi:hemerythrin domain-containing protein [Spirilliplanes yamanashiensis]|uniref:Hemerythrin-like domain-containing protein n=1 Tax=Spirilliplanes yamanashiensis TaxID=42233 RepID=A0A8J3Y4Y0_9ACTN|nr:hemerythrin domain-containing protein [Spirilliplanes yamanashiensis]MDP9819326.1 hypothetical protein [Spirilliplanes yamanashiensis]GIJ01851.1 hypothetical protein Sya03_12030 [Spirilliplanes yamanashiensis]